MAKNQKMAWWKWVLIGVAAIVGVSAIAGVSYASKDELKLNAGAYRVADVDEQGRVYEAETACVSMMIETTSAKLDFESKADVTVYVHYYDKDEKFLSSSEALNADVDLTAPENAEYMRFEIVPEGDDEISALEKIEYVNQVEIVYERA